MTAVPAINRPTARSPAIMGGVREARQDAALPAGASQPTLAKASHPALPEGGQPSGLKTLLPNINAPVVPSPDAAEQGPYDTNKFKAAYAKRLRYGESPSFPTPYGVQRAGEPVKPAGEGQRANDNLSGDAPAYVRNLGDTSHCSFNVDRNPFSDDVRRTRSFGGGSFRGGLPGSMMGSIGSMMAGMRGGMPMGSFYGIGGGGVAPMGSWYNMVGGGGASSMSRPASLFGSSFGGPFGMGGGMQGGSFFGMGSGGMPPMGSLYGLTGCMMVPTGEGGLGVPTGSLYGPAGNRYGSMCGIPTQNGQGGSQYRIMSDYAFSGLDSSNQYQGAYGPTALNGAGNVGGQEQDDSPTLPGQEQPQPGQQPATTAPSGGGPSQTSTAQLAAGHEGKGGEGKRGVTGLLVISPGPHPATEVALPGNPPTTLGAEAVIRSAIDAPGTAAAVRNHPSCHAIYGSVRAGHNAALLLATDGAAFSQAVAAEIVKQVLTEALAGVQATAAKHGECGYYDARVSVCALRSAREAVDCVEAGRTKMPEVGSHPVFGPAIINADAIAVSDIAAHMPQVEHAIAAAFAEDPPAKATVVEAIVKQLRPAQKGAHPTDLLLSSFIVLVSHVAVGSGGFFETFRDDAVVPGTLVKSCIGGACHTAAVLCLPDCSDPVAMPEAMNSFGAICNAPNSSPRSGNLARFITFATGENDKLRQKPDVDAAVLQRVDNMLNDGRAMLADPRNVIPVAYSSTSQRPSSRALRTPQLSSRDISDLAAGKARDASNTVRVAVIASPEASNGLPPTFSIGSDGRSIVDLATGNTAPAIEVVTRAPEDWRSTTLEEVDAVQKFFQNGHNTALVGTASPNAIHPLDKQPLWISFKRMVSSLLSVAAHKYKFAEVSVSVILVSGNELLADLLLGMGGVTPTPLPSQPLSVAYSPLFGPTVCKATIIKQPTALQLESTINGALYRVPAILEQFPDKRTIILASAVMKVVTPSDVYTSSLLAASATDPALFLDILDKKPDVPFELFEYAFGGPCRTLLLADVIQGDTTVTTLVELMNRLSTMQNRTLRPSSVLKFVAYAEESLRKADARAAAAASESEKEAILRGKKSMEILHAEYKTLAENPEHHDPKTYRRSGASSKDSDAARTTSEGGARSGRQHSSSLSSAPSKENDPASADSQRAALHGTSPTTNLVATEDEADALSSRMSSMERKNSSPSPSSIQGAGKKTSSRGGLRGTSSSESQGSRPSSSSHKHRHRNSSKEKRKKSK